METRIITVAKAAQDITDEQRQRVSSWLKANGVAPHLVSTDHDITIHYRVQGDRQGPGRIHYTQYYEDETGHKVADPGTQGAVTFPRCVAERVPLEPDPSGESDA
ncbi:hypothetical protein [Streptomyces nigrescens]